MRMTPFSRLMLAFVTALLLTACSDSDDPVSQANQGNFPDLTGSYLVGRTHYDMLDASRDEIFTTDESDKREFAITVFYPALPAADAELAAYIGGRLLSAYVEATELPEIVWQELQPHAWQDAEVAMGEFPVILFSHGLGLPIEVYTGQMEDLASRGYIVVGLSHTYETPGVLFSDGRLLLASEGFVADLEDSVSSEEEDQALGSSMTSVNAGDMRFVLDQLEVLNIGDSLLAGHVDLSQVGAAGHSLGGAAAFEAAYQDERILAAIDMDGSLYGDVRDNGLVQPAMAMIHDPDFLGNAADLPPEDIAEFEAHENQLRTVVQNATPGYLVSMPGASHTSFSTDILVMADHFPELVSADTAGLTGTFEDFNSARQIIHNTVLAFFNSYVTSSGEPQMSDLTFEGLDVTVFNEESRP